jgi:hypothetical protein
MWHKSGTRDVSKCYYSARSMGIFDLNPRCTKWLLGADTIYYMTLEKKKTRLHFETGQTGNITFDSVKMLVVNSWSFTIFKNYIVSLKLFKKSKFFIHGLTLLVFLCERSDRR